MLRITSIHKPPAPAQQFFERLSARLNEHEAVNHRFLRRFARGALSREQIARYAAQHYLYARNFSQNLSAVVANIPDEAARDVLIQNMYEEIGEPLKAVERVHRGLLERGLVTVSDIAAAYEGADGGADKTVARILREQGRLSEESYQAELARVNEEARERAHPALFRRFLTALGLGSSRLAQAEPIPETAAFIREYHEVCRSASWLEALGAMGLGTECMVPRFYAPILDGIAASKQMTPRDYIYWTLHVTCDDGHGANIVRALSPYASARKAQREIERGAARVLGARERWFDGLERLIFGETREASNA